MTVIHIILLTLKSVILSSAWNYFCSLRCQADHVVCRREPCGPGDACGQGFRMYPLMDTDRQTLVETVNSFRADIANGTYTKQVPKVSNMKALSYSKELEFMAQCSANTCLKEEWSVCRCSSMHDHVGYTFFREKRPDIATLDNSEIIKYFFHVLSEKLESLDAINHFKYYPSESILFSLAQLLWAASTHIGCVRSGEENGTVFTCNIATKAELSWTYPWKTGDPCSNCGDLACYQGTLCGQPEDLKSDTYKPPFDISTSGKSNLNPRLDITIFSYILIIGCNFL